MFLLDGRGWGHGVGMSQWGAEGYARHGFSYRQILAHYYPHTHVGIADPRDVRVLLVEKRESFRVASAAPFLVVDGKGRKLHLPDEIHDRLWMLARQRRSTVSVEIPSVSAVRLRLRSSGRVVPVTSGT